MSRKRESIFKIDEGLTTSKASEKERKIQNKCFSGVKGQREIVSAEA